MTELNKNICEGTVITEASLLKLLSQETYSGVDPDGLMIELKKEQEELDEEIVTAAEKLDGGDYGNAVCRALYDLNELKGGFCCATIGFLIDHQDFE